MSETRTDFAGQLVDATIAAGHGDIRHAGAVSEHRRLTRSAHRLRASALVARLRSPRRRVERDTVAVAG